MRKKYAFWFIKNMKKIDTVCRKIFYALITLSIFSVPFGFTKPFYFLIGAVFSVLALFVSFYMLSSLSFTDQYIDQYFNENNQ